MTLTFKSTAPETWCIVAIDTNGKQRTAVASRHQGDFNWQLRLEHPSGTTYRGTYHGESVIDALGAMVADKDVVYRQERARGYKAEPARRDVNRQVLDDGEFAPIIPIPQRRS